MNVRPLFNRLSSTVKHFQSFLRLHKSSIQIAIKKQYSQYGNNYSSFNGYCWYGYCALPVAVVAQRHSNFDEDTEIDSDAGLEVDVEYDSSHSVGLPSVEHLLEPPRKKQKKVIPEAPKTNHRRSYKIGNKLIAIRDLQTLSIMDIVDRFWPGLTGQLKKNRYSQVYKWRKNEKQLIKASLKTNGLKHKHCAPASNEATKLFTYAQEKEIYGYCKGYITLRLFVSAPVMLDWGFQIANKYGIENYNGGQHWLYGYLVRWGLSIQKHSLKRRPSIVNQFCKKRDSVWSNFLLKVLHHQIKPRNIWNVDQNGQHYMMYPKTIIAPIGQGQLYTPGTAQASTKKRFTFTVAENACGQLGYMCVTFKEKYDHFGRIIKPRLQNDPNTEYIWCQASTSGTQKKVHVMDYAENVLGKQKELRLLILDDLSSWSSDDNKEHIENITNSVIVSIPGGMTAFLQICDTILFADLVKILYDYCIEYLKNKTLQKAATSDVFDGKNIQTRPREVIIQHLCDANNHIATTKHESHAHEWIRCGFVNNLNESEDDQIHKILTGDITKKQKHYKFTSTMPETAEERLKMHMGHGKREKTLGTNEIYTRPKIPPAEELTASDLENPLTNVRNELRQKRPDLFTDLDYFESRLNPDEMIDLSGQKYKVVKPANCFYKPNGSTSVGSSKSAVDTSNIASIQFLIPPLISSTTMSPKQSNKRWTRLTMQKRRYLRGLGVSGLAWNDLIHNRQLSHEHICAFNNLAKQQFPIFQGLFDPRQGVEGMYTGSIQENGSTIHHVRDSNHYVLSTKYDDVISLYDSKDNGLHNTVSLQNQLSLVYPSIDSKYLRYTFKPCQQQKGSIACGYFSMARLYDFASGIIDLANIYYDQSKMNSHFMNNLLNGAITRFPLLSTSNVSLSDKSTFQIPLLPCCNKPPRFSREGIFVCSKFGCHKINHRVCNDLDRNSSREELIKAVCHDCAVERMRMALNDALDDEI
eukprot:328647_1